MLYIVTEGDLHTFSRSNIMFKYADDTNLLVPAYSDVSLLSEFEHVKQWAAELNWTELTQLRDRRDALIGHVSRRRDLIGWAKLGQRCSISLDPRIPVRVFTATNWTKLSWDDEMGLVIIPLVTADAGNMTTDALKAPGSGSPAQCSKLQPKCADTTGTVPVPWTGHYRC